uniref:Non-specific serine/threonine protein kinase n=1 Tax=Trichuris muris TaxID=70415 RepID=A0A5S6QDB3_TRIMR
MKDGANSSIAAVLEGEHDAKEFIGEAKRRLDIILKTDKFTPDMSSLFCSLAALHCESLLEEKKKDKAFADKWQTVKDAWTFTRRTHRQEFKCCDCVQAVGTCESKYASLKDERVECWVVSARDEIQTAINQLCNSMPKFCQVDFELRTLLDSLIERVIRARKSETTGKGKGPVINRRSTKDEELLKSAIEHVLHAFQDVPTPRLSRSFEAIFKTTVGAFLQNPTLDDLTWIITKLTSSPSIGGSWVPACVIDVLLALPSSSQELICTSFCLMLFAVFDLASKFALAKERQIETADSWIIIERVPQNDGRCSVNEEVYLPFFEMFNLEKLGRLGRKVYYCDRLGPLEKWRQFTKLAQKIISIAEATMRTFVNKGCYDSATYLAIIMTSMVAWLHSVKRDLSQSLNHLHEVISDELTYVFLSACKVIANCGRYTLWQSVFQMPLPTSAPTDEWRMLFILFCPSTTDTVAKLMETPLHLLKGFVREAVRTTDMGVRTDKDQIIFYVVVGRLVRSLKDPDTIYISILAMLMKGLQSDDEAMWLNLEKCFSGLIRWKPSIVEHIILAAEESLKRIGKDAHVRPIQKLPFDHLRLNSRTWPVLKMWFRCPINSQRFSLAHRILGMMAMKYKTLTDDPFTAELIDVLSQQFRKKVSDTSLKKVHTLCKLSTLTRGLLTIEGCMTPFEQFCWNVVACVKITNKSKSRNVNQALSIFPTKHRLFEAFVRFQTGHESEIAVESFLNTLVKVRVPAGIGPAVIHLVRKSLADSSQALPSHSKMQEWMNCMVNTPVADSTIFPYADFFFQDFSEVIIDFHESKPTECVNAIECILEAVCPGGGDVWSMSIHALSLLSRCIRMLDELGSRPKFYYRWFFTFVPDRYMSAEKMLTHYKGAVDKWIQIESNENELKFLDLAFRFGGALHEHAMAIDTDIPQCPGWRYAAGRLWLHFCSRFNTYRFSIYTEAVRCMYKVLTDQKSLFSTRELIDIAAQFADLVKSLEWIRHSHKEMFSCMVSWTKKIAAFTDSSNDQMPLPRSPSLEDLLTVAPPPDSIEEFIAEAMSKESIESNDDLSTLMGQLDLNDKELIEKEKTATPANHKELTELVWLTDHNGRSLIAFTDFELMELLSHSLEKLDEQTCIFKGIEKGVQDCCTAFGTVIKLADLYVPVKAEARLHYEGRTTVRCSRCHSQAPTQMTVTTYQLDAAQENAFKSEWFRRSAGVKKNCDQFLETYALAVGVIDTVVREYGRRNETPNVQGPYSEREKTAILNLIASTSKFVDPELPAMAVCGDVVKRLRKSLIKAILYRCGCDAGEIVSSFFVDSVAFSSLIRDIPVDLLTADQFLLSYGSFLRVLTLPDGANVDCRMVLGVLDVARLESNLNGALVLRLMQLILSTYRDSKLLINPNPEIRPVIGGHFRFLMMCQEMAHFECGLMLLINEYFGDCSDLLSDVVNDLSEKPKLFNLGFESVCRCLDCLEGCATCAQGSAVALSLYRICVCRKVDLWREAKQKEQKEASYPSEHELSETVGKAVAFTARWVTMDDEVCQLALSLIEQRFLIARCLSDFLIEVHPDLIGSSLLSLVLAGFSYFNSLDMDDGTEKVMERYATEIRWNAVVPSIETVCYFISLIGNAKRKQKLFYVRAVIQLRWKDFVASSVDHLSGSIPTIAAALELVLLCSLWKGSQQYTNSLIDILALFKQVPKATVVGSSREKVLLAFSRSANYEDLCAPEKTPQRMAVQLLNHLMCFDGAADQHTCGEVCTESQGALLAAMLNLYQRCYDDLAASKPLPAQWASLLGQVCSAILMSGNRFVLINRGKALFQQVTSFLIGQDERKASLIDATIQWMRTPSAIPNLNYLLNSLSENLATNSAVCLALMEECLKAYFAGSMSASWNDAIANYAVPTDSSNDLSTECRQKEYYWVYHCHLLSRMYEVESTVDVAELAQECAAVWKDLLDKEAEEHVCAMYLLLLVNAVSLMAEQHSVLTTVVLKQLCTALVALRRDNQPKGLISNIILWKKTAPPTRFLLLCAIVEAFVGERLLADLTPEEAFGDVALISLQALKGLTAFDAYASTIDFAGNVDDSAKGTDGLANLYAAVSKVALTLYSERCVADRCAV